MAGGAATINTEAADFATSIGNITGSSALIVRLGTGNYSLDGVAGSTYTIGASTTTGTITIGGTAQSGTMTLGSSSASNTLVIGGGSGATTVQIANTQTAGSVAIGASMTTGTIAIGGTGLQTGTITIGGGTGAQTVNLGTGATGVKTIHIGDSAVANVITLGSTTGAASTTINSGSGNVNIAGGNFNLPTTTSTVGSILINNNAVLHSYGDVSNIFVGGAGNYTLSGSTNNTCVGYQSGAGITTTAGGQGLIAVGYQAGKAVTTGGFNVAMGYTALSKATSSGNNTAIGVQALLNVTTGNGTNVAVGYTAALNLTTGTQNTVIGVNPDNGQYTGAESYNVLLGGPHCGATTGESNVMRLGMISNADATAKTFIAGITGVAVTGTAVLCSTAGQLGTISSSRKYKDNIQDMDDSSCIYDLKAKNFTMKNDVTKHRQWGFIAEEVEDVNKNLVNYHHETGEIESVRYLDLIPMLVNELQKATRRIEMLENKLGN